MWGPGVISIKGPKGPLVLINQPGARDLLVYRGQGPLMSSALGAKYLLVVGAGPLDTSLLSSQERSKETLLFIKISCGALILGGHPPNPPGVSKY